MVKIKNGKQQSKWLSDIIISVDDVIGRFAKEKKEKSIHFVKCCSYHVFVLFFSFNLLFYNKLKIILVWYK